MDQPTPEPPFPDACRTGRAFITWCCTAATYEFLSDGVLFLAFHVAGHSWERARPGCIDEINDDDTIVDRGTERRVRWRANREGR